jgi:hypothetical protein
MESVMCVVGKSLTDLSATLASYGLKSGCKVMVLGSVVGLQLGCKVTVLGCGSD